MGEMAVLRHLPHRHLFQSLQLAVVVMAVRLMMVVPAVVHRHHHHHHRCHDLLDSDSG
jgi:hypothetical protein